jgi:glycolate oxidase iron-sulfur subunit
LAALLRRLLPRGAGRLRFGLAMLAATRSWSGLRALPGVSAGAGAAAGQIPGGRVTGAGRSGLPAAAEARPPRVAMLQGCVQEALYARVNRATERVLRAAGCELVAVPGQECCGALHAHSGELGGAHELARANILAFERAGIDHVVVNAAGCGAMMKEYGEQLGEDPEWSERAHAFARKVRDLNELLLELELPPGGAVDLKVTYDAPCHLHHAQRITRAPVELVGRIPGVRYVALRQADECCGGAGIYGVTHPELGGRILADKIDAVLETGADVVVTPNPGCMMQIGAGLLQRGSAVRVLHPIELLDESFRRAGLYS